MLSVARLKKCFKSRVAVDDVTFAVRTGETLGLLGPNGAGKTTTLAMISGLVEPDAGEFSFRGQVLRHGSPALKTHVGLVPQDLALYDELSAWANLELFGGLYGLSGSLLASRAHQALALVGLAERRGDRVGDFSGGMKRRLNIAGALLHDPELLLLDEPTVGVDPQSRNAIFENLDELKRRGKTLIYTTHYMEEAERLCDRIVIMDHGRVVADDTLSGVHGGLGATRAVTLEFAGLPPPDGVLTGLAAIPGILAAAKVQRGIRIETADYGASLAHAIGYLDAQGLRILALASERTSLEDVFIRLTGHALRDDADKAPA